MSWIGKKELGLLSHLNEREFLSDYGLHSISKLDPAYDQVDIDHGGGGSYVAFPALIAESLYKGGYSDPAEDILKGRYGGDSDYRIGAIRWWQIRFTIDGTLLFNVRWMPLRALNVSFSVCAE